LSQLREYFKVHFYLSYVFYLKLHWNDNACACDCQIIFNAKVFSWWFQFVLGGARRRIVM
jgi:hypothetical protein